LSNGNDDDGDGYEDNLRMDRMVLSRHGEGQKEAAFGVIRFSGVLLLLMMFYGHPALELLGMPLRVPR
jgi:hypothetical protein